MNIVRNILAVIGAVAVLLFVFRVVIPLAHPSESITQGSYRGLSIGADKTGTAREILKRNRLELTGFEGVDGEFASAYFDTSGNTTIMSDVWYVQVEGIHRENLELTFADGQLVQVRYQRNAFDP